MSEEHRNQPWLARKDWASRRLVSEQSGWLTIFIACLVMFVIASGAFVTWLLGFAAGEPALGSIGAGLLLAGGSWVLLRRVRSHGTRWSVVKFSCRLETLPGVIGGWFKAQVDAELPAAPESASVRLVFLEGEDIEGAPNGIWSVVYELGSSDLIAIGDGRFRIPVRFQIPGRLANFTDHPRWVLTTSVRLSGQTSYSGSFVVPIYRTQQAPASEQQPEQPFVVREETGGSWASRLLGPRRL